MLPDNEYESPVASLKDLLRTVGVTSFGWEQKGNFSHTEWSEKRPKRLQLCFVLEKSCQDIREWGCISQVGNLLYLVILCP